MVLRRLWVRTPRITALPLRLATRSFTSSALSAAPSSSSHSATQTLARSLGRRTSLSRAASEVRARVAASSSAASNAAAVATATAPSEVGLSTQSELQALFRMREPVRRHAVTPAQPVPSHIVRPPYIYGKPLPSQSGPIALLSAEDIASMRPACRLASEVRAFAGTLITPGRTTDDIDRLCHELIVARGAYPSPLGYRGFPKSVCTSVNEVVCHGIPDLRPLRDGDIVNVDISVYLNGFHGDCSATFAVGPSVDAASLALVTHTRAALDLAIRACAPGVPLNRIGAVIADYIEARGYGVVESYAGHGIARDFHLSPTISHYRNSDSRKMARGMVFTIEPMISEGVPDTYVLDDGWTVVTGDNKRSAQFEDTIAISDTGAEILTRH